MQQVISEIPQRAMLKSLVFSVFIHHLKKEVDSLLMVQN